MLSFDRKISSQMALIILMVIGLFIAWFTIRTGEKIISGFPDSKVFASEQAIQKEIQK